MVSDWHPGVLTCYVICMSLQVAMAPPSQQPVVQVGQATLLLYLASQYVVTAACLVLVYPQQQLVV